MAEETKKIDNIVNALLTGFGDWTGKNIARQIFCNLDYESLMQVRLVCKSWNSFVTKDRFIWLKMLWNDKNI